MIGLFDSGIGGISILNQIVRRLPAADCHYVADRAFFPYGQKRREDIIQRSCQVANFLLQRGCRLIVVACNSATGAAIADLRRTFDVPFVGIEPGIKVARRYLDRGPIGVLCTDLTSSGEKYRRLMESQGLNDRVITHTSRELARIIEEGKIQGEGLHQYLSQELEPFRKHAVGCLVLGCTHYGFVRAEIESILGVPVLEPAGAVARRAITLYSRENPSKTEPGKTFFYSSDDLGGSRDRVVALFERPPVSWSQVDIRTDKSPDGLHAALKK